MRRALLLVVIALVGCPKSEPAPVASASSVPPAPPAPPASSVPVVPSASASASAIEEDASDAVTLEWRAAATKDPNAADVSIVVAGKAEFLGTMDRIGDGDYGACRIIADVATKTYSRFQCGDTPGYHYYAATLGAGELVIKLVHGDFGDPHSEKSRLVKRIPVSGSRLVVRPYRARP